MGTGIQKIFTLRHLFCLKPKRNQQIIPCYKLFSSNICRITNINIDEKNKRDSTFVETFGIWLKFEGPSLTFSFTAFVHASSVTHSQVPKPIFVTTGLNQGQSHQTHFRLGILTLWNTSIVTWPPPSAPRWRLPCQMFSTSFNTYNMAVIIVFQLEFKDFSNVAAQWFSIDYVIVQHHLQCLFQHLLHDRHCTLSFDKKKYVD